MKCADPRNKRRSEVCVPKKLKSALKLGASVVSVFLGNAASAALITSATWSVTQFADCSEADRLASQGATDANFGGAVNCSSRLIQPAVGDIFNLRSESAALNVSGSTVSSTENAQGLARASAAFGPVVGAPVLKAQADSSSDGGILIVTGAVQRFDNTGTEAITSIFGGEIDYILSDVNPSAVSGPPSEASGVEIGIALFTTPSGFIDVDIVPSRIAGLSLLPQRFNRDFGGSIFNRFSESEGSNEFSLFSDEVTILPGESLFVAVNLFVTAFRGSDADAFSTFTTGFYEESLVNGQTTLTRIVDPNNPVASQLLAVREVGQVPVPSSLSLLALSLLLLGRKAGLRRAARAN